MGFVERAERVARQRMKRRTRWLALVSVTAAVALAGCGGSSTNPIPVLTSSLSSPASEAYLAHRMRGAHGSVLSRSEAQKAVSCVVRKLKAKGITTWASANAAPNHATVLTDMRQCVLETGIPVSTSSLSSPASEAYLAHHMRAASGSVLSRSEAQKAVSCAVRKLKANGITTYGSANTAPNHATVITDMRQCALETNLDPFRRGLTAKLRQNPNVPSADVPKVVNCIISKLKSQGIESVGELHAHSSEANVDETACAEALRRTGSGIWSRSD
jgi:hypothetical protein